MKTARSRCASLRQHIRPTDFEHLAGSWAMVEDPDTGEEIALVRPAYVNLLGSASTLLDRLKDAAHDLDGPHDPQAIRAYLLAAIEQAEAIEPTAKDEAARDRERMRAYYHMRLLRAGGKFEQAELRAKINAL